MTRQIDLTNEVFGELRVTGYAYSNEASVSYWHCECSCGENIICSMPSLRKDGKWHCGCKKQKQPDDFHDPIVDLRGSFYGSLEVLDPYDVVTYRRYWICACECNRVYAVSQRSLLRGQARSCGCLQGMPGWGPGVLPDIFGKRFGPYTIISLYDDPNYTKQDSFLCMCDCGQYEVFRKKEIRKGRKHSCGLKYPFNPETDVYNPYPVMGEEDLTGRTVGMLTVNRFIGTELSGRTLWECICECSRISYVDGATLKNLRINSCGCLQPEIASQAMKRRWGSV